MMIGTPIESSIWPGYLLIVFFVVEGFSIYDTLYKRVPNRALACLIPLAALAPALKTYFIFESGQIPHWLYSPVMISLMGGLTGFAIPLAAAMLTRNGIGGGDIKFCGILGLIYGPSGIVLVLLVATGFVIPVMLVFRYFGKNTHSTSIPFLPFLVCGCYMATLAQLFR